MPLTGLTLDFKALYASLAQGTCLKEGTWLLSLCPQLGGPCSSYVAALQALGSRVDNFGQETMTRFECALKQGYNSLSWPSHLANPLPPKNDGFLLPNDTEFG